MTDDESRAEALLGELRHSIDNLDAILLHTLAERFRCTQTVGKLKAEHGLPAADPATSRFPALRQLHRRQVRTPQWRRMCPMPAAGQTLRLTPANRLVGRNEQETQPRPCRDLV